MCLNDTHIRFNTNQICGLVRYVNRIPDIYRNMLQEGKLDVYEYSYITTLWEQILYSSDIELHEDKGIMIDNDTREKRNTIANLYFNGFKDYRKLPFGYNKYAEVTHQLEEKEFILVNRDETGKGTSIDICFDFMYRLRDEDYHFKTDSMCSLLWNILDKSMLDRLSKDFRYKYTVDSYEIIDREPIVRKPIRIPVIIPRKAIMIERQAIEIQRTPIVERTPICIKRTPIKLQIPDYMQGKNIKPRKLNLNAKKYQGLTPSQIEELEIMSCLGTEAVEKKLKAIRTRQLRIMTDEEQDCLNKLVPYYNKAVCETTKRKYFSILSDAPKDMPKKSKYWKSLFNTYELCLENNWNIYYYIDAQFDAVKKWKSYKQGKCKYPMPNMMYSERAIISFKTYYQNGYDWEMKYNANGIHYYPEPEFKKTVEQKIMKRIKNDVVSIFCTMNSAGRDRFNPRRVQYSVFNNVPDENVYKVIKGVAIHDCLLDGGLSADYIAVIKGAEETEKKILDEYYDDLDILHDRLASIKNPETKKKLKESFKMYHSHHLKLLEGIRLRNNPLELSLRTRLLKSAEKSIYNEYKHNVNMTFQRGYLEKSYYPPDLAWGVVDICDKYAEKKIKHGRLA